MQGWIKLHRKLLLSDIFQNEKMLKVFIYCLTKCTHKETEVRVGKQKVLIKPGQFVYGRKKASMEMNMKESTIKDYMNALKEDGVITVDSTNKYSVVTVVKWGDYQSHDDDSTNKIPAEYQQNDNKIPAKHQQNTTYKNVKNLKNDKEELDDDNKDPENPHTFYEQNFGMLKPFVSQNITEWSSEMSDELVVASMKLAVKNNKSHFGYCEAILRDWQTKGVKTLEDARALQRPQQQAQSNVTPIRKPEKQYNYGF